MSKIVLLDSGGIESLINAKKLKDEGYDVYSVHINFGLPSSAREQKSAEWIASMYCVDHATIQIQTPADKSPIYMVTESTGVQRPFWMRKSRVAIALGTTFAIGWLQDTDIYTANGGTAIDNDADYDTRAVNYLNGGRPVQTNIIAKQPLRDYPTLADRVAYAYSIGITTEDLQKTVSCYFTEPCGQCNKCLSRIDLGISEVIW